MRMMDAQWEAVSTSKSGEVAVLRVMVEGVESDSEWSCSARRLKGPPSRPLCCESTGH